MTSILITGASRGIGRALAEHVLRAGHDVIATARKAADLENLACECRQLDVTENPSIAAFKAALNDRPIDILINNAGIFGPRGMTAGRIDYEAWPSVLATNSIAPMRLAEALMPNLKAGRRKIIANISSRMGSMAQSGGNEYIYRSSKAALNATMRALAMDLADDGFTIVLLHPGWVRTDMGGPSATLSIDESTGRLAKTILDLSPDDNGRFLNFDGAPIDW